MGPLCTGATGHGNAPYAGPRMTYPSADIGNASTPVAIFAFARPDHLRRTIQSLQANAEAALTNVTVYCDGPRNQSDIPQVADRKSTRLNSSHQCASRTPSST